MKGIIIGLVLLFVGAVYLHLGVSDAMRVALELQTTCFWPAPRLIFGAILLAAGSVLVGWHVGRAWERA